MKSIVTENMTEEDQRLIDWHSGFAGGIGLSLREYRESISIEREHPLSKEPLRIDFLVIKKNKDIVIDNAIGRMFRLHNILEYKSQKDDLSIDVLWKCIGYAGLYKGLSDTVNEIPAEELTVSILRYSKPRKLLNDLRENGFRIETPESGIYRIIGVVSLPLQIIVIRELEDDKLLALKIMSDHAKEDDVRRFLTASRSFYIPGDRHDADAVLQVSSSANRELYQKIRKEEIMCQALKEIMSEEIAEEHAKGLAEGRVEGLAEGRVEGLAEGRAEGQEQERLSSIKNLMDSLKLSAEEAMNALKISASDQARYAAKL